MLIAAGTFVLVLGLVMGIYWALILKPEARSRADLKERMAPKKTAKKRRLLVTSPDGDDEAPPSIVQGLRKLCAPLQRSLDRSGMKISLEAFVLLSIWIGGLTAVLLWIATRRLEI